MIDTIEPRRMHDTRASNGMTDEHKFAHAMLERWASWARDSVLAPWPRQTVMARVIEMGPDGAAARGFMSTECPPDIALIDKVILKLMPRDAAVIRKYYLEWKPALELAAELCIKEWQFHAWLRHARSQVAFGLFMMIPESDIF